MFHFKSSEAMTEGFKNREVLTMPMQYTVALIGDMGREYLRYGSITISEPVPSKRRKSNLYNTWDLNDYRKEEAKEVLLDYLSFLDECGDDELINR